MKITDLSEPALSFLISERLSFGLSWVPILPEIRLNCVHMKSQPISRPVHVVFSQATYIGNFKADLDTERCRSAKIDLRDLGSLLARSLLQCKDTTISEIQAISCFIPTRVPYLKILSYRFCALRDFTHSSDVT